MPIILWVCPTGAAVRAWECARSDVCFRASKLYYEPVKLEDDADEEDILGSDVNFTVFRNVQTGAAIELVDDVDVPGLGGRFLIAPSSHPSF